MQNTIPSNNKLLKTANDSLVMNLIRQRGPISRADIAKLTNLTPPTVTNIINKLQELNLIVEYAMGESSGGRRPLLLKTNPQALNVIVVHISSNKLSSYLTDGDLNILRQESRRIKNLSKEEILDLMISSISAYQKEATAGIPGIGVVVHGPVKAREGISIFAPNIGWKNVPIKFIVEDKLHIPTFVENDVRAMTLGEFYYGCARDINNMVFLKVGYGIGSGIILDGKLYRGLSDSAGEIGHTTIDVGGPQCSCGNYGCLEAMASENALVRTMVKSIKEGRHSMVVELVQGDLESVTPETIYEAASHGDILACRILRQVARYLGIAIANIINTFNPELVVLGGGITHARPFIEETILETVKDRALESCCGVCKISFSTMGEEATLKGAADMVLTEVL
ncbi:ROK family transcriptional regulator [Thermoanaerobacterium sp. DL9XJH110]|uniref:ROK family transcriptional regulator n=1 Tax=Thermoanaerobacterium sp. DL9XJH110 TaxID=3386643 RepID=UPI003BB59C63